MAIFDDPRPFYRALDGLLPIYPESRDLLHRSGGQVTICEVTIVFAYSRKSPHAFV